MPRMFSHVLTDGSIAIISLSDRYLGDSVKTEYFLLKTCYELHKRFDPDFTKDAGQHFDDYTDPRDWVVREIQPADLPPRGSRRHAWREREVAGRKEIFDDLTIP